MNTRTVVLPDFKLLRHGGEQIKRCPNRSPDKIRRRVGRVVFEHRKGNSCADPVSSVVNPPNNAVQYGFIGFDLHKCPKDCNDIQTSTCVTLSRRSATQCIRRFLTVTFAMHRLFHRG